MSQLSHRPPSNGTGGNITCSIDTFEEGEIEVFVNDSSAKKVIKEIMSYLRFIEKSQDKLFVSFFS